MPEKLLTIEEVAALLGLSEDGVRKLVEKGDLPAYKVGGQYLRFRKEQIEAIKNEIPTKTVSASPQTKPNEHQKKIKAVTYRQSIGDRLLDFFYFNDFYIVAIILIAAVLWFIFTG
ncbi:MAG: hypothetical protein A2Z72_02705 [Omnitrophica bacterium RBG_13_46_9]|nr:MAG: hypothetical protein A2Z72_02705 [Omnitrophica bacterium RBG_13_46_9]